MLLNESTKHLYRPDDYTDNCHRMEPWALERVAMVKGIKEEL